MTKKGHQENDMDIFICSISDDVLSLDDDFDFILFAKTVPLVCAFVRTAFVPLRVIFTMNRIKAEK